MDIDLRSAESYNISGRAITTDNVTASGRIESTVRLPASPARVTLMHLSNGQAVLQVMSMRAHIATIRGPLAELTVLRDTLTGNKPTDMTGVT